MTPLPPMEEEARAPAAFAWKRVLLWFWAAASVVFVSTNLTQLAVSGGWNARDAFDGVALGLLYAAGYGSVFAITPVLAVQSRRRSRALVLLAVFAAVNLAYLLMDGGVCLVMGPDYCSLTRGWVQGRLASTPLLLLISISLVGWSTAQTASAELQESEVAAHRARTERAQARLGALNAQLQPHFLFNTLQSVVTLLHREPESARRMLDRLETLLRRSAAADHASEVPLREELETISLYTGIESIRFGDRLVVEASVEEGLEEVWVPHLVLQPIVENAIRYAVAQRGTGRVRIHAALDPSGSRVLLTVANNGPPADPPRVRDRAAVGIANVTRRIEVLYGSAARVTVEALPQGGACATIVLPRRAPQQPQDTRD